MLDKTASSLPRWCDPRCEYASFTEETALDGSGSCRTFSALYCAVLERIVARNAPCAARLELEENR